MAFVRKTSAGRFRGVAKSGRVILGSKTFDRRRDALAWAQQLETAAAGGTDVRAGRVTVGALLPAWVVHRRETVAVKTAQTDAELPGHLSAAFKARAVGAVTPTEVSAWLTRMLKAYSYGAVSRRRDSLSAFFEWCVGDRRIERNPVHAAPMPKRQAERVEMNPFTEAELTEVVEQIRATSSEHFADVVLLLGWTGLRWGEARSLRVGDVRRVPVPALRVRRSQSEGKHVKTTKGRAARTVPLADVVVPVVERLASGKKADDLLITGPRGGQLWNARFRRLTSWSVLGRGRRLHDLRHTAACMWLSRGVDLGTVSAWLGHSTVTITNEYLHYLGTAADRAALSLLNDGGAPGVRDDEQETNDD